MFVCVSLNPAIDKRLRIERLRLGTVNRVREVTPAPGGKAAHVAMVLRTLGADPLWLGFAGGDTGRALTGGLAALSIRADVVPIADSTRTNLEIVEDDGTVTEILEPGPSVSQAEMQQLQKRIEDIVGSRASSEPAIVIFSGSLPKGAGHNAYAMLIDVVHRCKGVAFVDTSGEALRLSVEAGPEFVKPNQSEAEAFGGSSIRGPEWAANVLEHVLRTGAKAGAISLGAEGLVFGSQSSEMVWARAPRQESHSSVGSGDATVAGFAFAAERGLNPAEAARLAAACGAANCLADSPGRPSAVEIERLRAQVELEVLRAVRQGSES